MEQTGDEKIFLTGQWRHLAMINFEIDPALLLPRVPPGTELDLFEGKALLSAVGFMFTDTAIFGIPVPMHRNFEEVNLRFNVRRHTPDGVRRGVVFIKEIVPSWAVAQVARAIYNENYTALPMDHHVDLSDGALAAGGRVEYAWRIGPRWHRLRVQTSGAAFLPPPGSVENFIVEHYHGYVTQRDGCCMEYRVAHDPWRVWPVSGALLETDVAALYGTEFCDALNAAPHSALLAEGSPVVVHRGCRMPAEVAHEHHG